MITILSLILSGIYTVLAFIHFAWALGGKWGFDFAVPTNENGEKMFNPQKKDCIVVGLGLSIFALFYLIKSNITFFEIPYWIFEIGGWIIPSVFIIRAIGDFKYIGFFKKTRSTNFGHLDTRFFSPLCLLIGLSGMIIQIS